MIRAATVSPALTIYIQLGGMVSIDATARGATGKKVGELAVFVFSIHAPARRLLTLSSAVGAELEAVRVELEAARKILSAKTLQFSSLEVTLTSLLKASQGVAGQRSAT